MKKCFRILELFFLYLFKDFLATDGMLASSRLIIFAGADLRHF